MCALKRKFFWILILLYVIRLSGQEKTVLYYGRTINDVLCGYWEVTSSRIEEGGRDLTLMDCNIEVHAKALGSEFVQKIKFVYHIDSKTGNFVYHTSWIKQGDIELSAEFRVEGSDVVIKEEEKSIRTELPQGVVLPNVCRFEFLTKAFQNEDVAEAVFQLFEVRDGTVQENIFRLLGRETLDLSGKEWKALKLERKVPSTGVQETLWLDALSGCLLKQLSPGKLGLFLTDSSVKKRIVTSSIDQNLTTRTNQEIANSPDLIYMKVRARLKPTGLRVTAESLNGNGQKFSGDVKSNRIDGVFEIAIPLYAGKNPPVFSNSYSENQELRQYLEQDRFIESKDPVLTAKARKLTTGAKDSWDAVQRLSTWVSDSIHYAIPGGGTARKTYDIRQGECGAFSKLLVAFCRSVGIPARVVWGCVYAPSDGGIFAQHGWTEVFMGEAGWVPIDATGRQTNFCDSGHIRIGELISVETAVRGEFFEILDYRLETRKTMNAASKQLSSYLGTYVAEGFGQEIHAEERNGILVLDIVGRTALPFRNPDDQGRWYCQLSNALYVQFNKNSGNEPCLEIHEVVYSPRRGDLENEETVPPNWKGLIGKYLFTPMNSLCEVSIHNGSLSISIPSLGLRILRSTDNPVHFTFEDGKRIIRFQCDATGKAVGMEMEGISRFFKIKSLTPQS